jgi:hypothetical protein
MKKMMLIASAAVVLMSASESYAGNCDHSWQTAADGSRCGLRSRDSRSGGDYGGGGFAAGFLSGMGEPAPQLYAPPPAYYYAPRYAPYYAPYYAPPAYYAPFGYPCCFGGRGWWRR